MNIRLVGSGWALKSGRWNLQAFLRTCLALTLLMAGYTLHATTYYVDARSGSDGAPGTSQTHPWKTLEKVNATHFQPGDTVLFRAGSTWQGQLAPSSSGAEQRPIVIDRYGEGARPRIDGKGLVTSVLYLHNVQQIEVRNLEITNEADKPSLRRGVDVFLENYGTARHIVLSDLYIHDVTGTNARKENGGIVFRSVGDRVSSRFDDLRIERNIVWKVDRSGIVAESYHASRTRWFPSLNVVIRDNYLEDIGGDGIVPWATERALVEHNIVKYCNRRAGTYNAGIWPWSTDNTIIQLNEASFTQGTRDGQGFDSDFNSRNSLFQYNYSHDNEGGFILLCTPVARNEKENVGNTGTLVRWNVSRNDHARIFNLSGASDLVVEENAIFVGPGHDVQLMLVSPWDGWSKDALFRRNRFYVAGTARYGHSTKRHEDGTYEIAPGWGPATNIRFQENSYFGKSHLDAPSDMSEPSVETAIPAWADDGPTFDPSRPDGFGMYLRRHREWMMAMLQRQLGRSVELQP